MPPLPDLQLPDKLEYARNPEAWLFCANQQMAVAELLFRRRDELTPGSGEKFEEFSGCSIACFMHAGLAIENAVKAVLVARDPKIFRSDGRLDKKKLGTKSGHGILQLVESIIPDLTDADRKLLIKLEQYLLWAGRYPTPKNAADLCDRDLKTLRRISPFGERARIEKLFERIIKLVHLRDSAPT